MTFSVSDTSSKLISWSILYGWLPWGSFVSLEVVLVTQLPPRLSSCNSHSIQAWRQSTGLQPQRSEHWAQDILREEPPAQQTQESSLWNIWPSTQGAPMYSLWTCHLPIIKYSLMVHLYISRKASVHHAIVLFTSFAKFSRSDRYSILC